MLSSRGQNKVSPEVNAAPRPVSLYANAPRHRGRAPPFDPLDTTPAATEEFSTSQSEILVPRYPSASVPWPPPQPFVLSCLRYLLLKIPFPLFTFQRLSFRLSGFPQHVNPTLHGQPPPPASRSQ